MNKIQEITENQTQVCPFLGLRDDPESHMTFTSPSNCCHASKSLAPPVKLEHQNSHCLTSTFAICPVFVTGDKQSFPGELRAKTHANQDYPLHRRRLPLLSFLVVALIALGVSLWLLDRYALSRAPASAPFPTGLTAFTATKLTSPVQGIDAALEHGTPTATPNPAFSATLTPFPSLTLTPSPSLTITNTPTQTLTSLPSPTSTLSPTATLVSPHALDVPIGRVQRYIIHRVLRGESLNILAEQNQTSIEAILAVNYTLTLPVWEDAIVIIPFEMSNPEGLPVFEAYQVTYEKISVENLAAVLATDPVLLKYFNVVEDGKEFQKDDWLLVPRLRAEDS